VRGQRLDQMVGGGTVGPLFRKETKNGQASLSLARSCEHRFGARSSGGWIRCVVERRSAAKDHISVSEERPHEECRSCEQGNIRKKTVEWHRGKLSQSFSVGNGVRPLTWVINFNGGFREGELRYPIWALEISSVLREPAGHRANRCDLQTRSTKAESFLRRGRGCRSRQNAPTSATPDAHLAWEILVTGSEICRYEVTAAKTTKTQNKPAKAKNKTRVHQGPHTVLSAPQAVITRTFFKSVNRP